MSAQMFRRSALQRVSSPEQFDSVVRSALPRQWLAVAVLLVVVAVAVIWASVATVPTTLSGPGYLLPEGGLQAVDAPVAGTLATLSVGAGDQVALGQQIGTVTPPAVAGRPQPPVEVVASRAGVATEVDASAGNYVTAGQLIALTEPAGLPLVVYTYLPDSEAAGLPAGLQARVTFSGGIGTTYGYALGRVATVSSYPVSQQRLELVLHAGALVNAVQAQGPSDEIVVELDRSAATPSGLAWGSGHGPPGVLPPGLPATVQLVLGSHHPISDVF